MHGLKLHCRHAICLPGGYPTKTIDMDIIVVLPLILTARIVVMNYNGLLCIV